MSGPSVYTWSTSAAAEFCAPQNATAGVPLIFNGATPKRTNNTTNPSFGGVSRTVSVTVTNAGANKNIVITGLLMGKVVSATVVNPIVGTTETTQLFDTLTSVTSSIDQAGGNTIAVGSGTVGNTNWFMIDPYRPFMSLAVDVQATSEEGADLSYSFLSTMQDPTKFDIEEDIDLTYRRGIVITNPDDVNAFTKVMVAASTSQVACLTTPALYACIVVDSSDDGGSFIARFLQQGIK